VQLHVLLQKVYPAKHSQYNLRQRDFLQLHPRISFSGVAKKSMSFWSKIFSGNWSEFFLVKGGGVLSKKFLFL
jgi:hypothetical protein